VEIKEKSPPSTQATEPDLGVLLGLITRQDQAAFARLYDASSARVYGLALRITGQREAAEEVTSDAYLQIWQQAARYEPTRGSPLAWVLTITRSRALDWLRRRDLAQTYPDPTLLQTDAPLADDPVDLLAALDRSTRLHQAIAELPNTARQLLGLAFLRGLTHQEIADHTRMPLGTVKTILRTAMQTLRPRLATAWTTLEESR
jgi:RNA polymerase sigma-70 factor (ECF subfamily)